MAILLTEPEMKSLQQKGVEVNIGWQKGGRIQWYTPVSEKALVAFFFEAPTMDMTGYVGKAQYVKYMAFHNGGKIADVDLRVGGIDGGDRWCIDLYRRFMLWRVRRALGV